MTRILSSIFVLLFTLSCASTKTASYHYTQKQIENSDLDFESHLRVDEYINAFPQDELARPKSGQDLAVEVDYFTDSLPKNKTTTIAQIAVRTREASPVEKTKKFGICLVLDKSGSMTADSKFRNAMQALFAMVSNLPEGTEFALVTFASDANVVINPTVLNQKTRQLIKNELLKIETGGGTNIEAGLVLGYETMSRFSKDSQSRLILLTDGKSTVGTTDPKELAKKAGAKYSAEARISTIGLGYQVDEKFLRELAEKGRGAYYFAERSSSLLTLFEKNIESLMIPIAQEVKIEITGGPDTVLKKVYGYDKPITNNSQVIDIGEMNSDDWRVFVVEVESRGKSVSIEATASYTSAERTDKAHAKALKRIALDDNKKVQINSVVARNAVIFSNAMALIEVSRLDKDLRYKEAEDIVDVQLANLTTIRTLDKTSALDQELATLTRVKQVLRMKQGYKPELYQGPPPGPKRSALKPFINGAFILAERAIFGPWSVIFNLISVALD